MLPVPANVPQGLPASTIAKNTVHGGRCVCSVLYRNKCVWSSEFNRWGTKRKLPIPFHFQSNETKQRPPVLWLQTPKPCVIPRMQLGSCYRRRTVAALVYHAPSHGLGGGTMAEGARSRLALNIPPSFRWQPHDFRKVVLTLQLYFTQRLASLCSVRAARRFMMTTQDTRHMAVKGFFCFRQVPRQATGPNSVERSL